MRKFTALAGIAALLSIVPTTPAIADPVIDPGADNCEMIVPDENGDLTGAAVTGGTLNVRDNKTWVTMTCHFDLTEDQLPTRTVHARGFSCSIPPFGSTTDTRATANTGGRMVLTCRKRK